MSEFVFEVPLRIDISIGDSTTPAASARAPLEPAAAEAGLERVELDADYANRAGYDADFLGVAVPLPVLSDEQRRNAAKNSQARPGEDNTVLPYHHFSIVMNRRRQLAYYTAVNIDGARSKTIERSGDRWYFDRRIAESEQIGGELYARNQLDRGHLVRRLDPAWGSMSEALKANNDTFHFTNCTPQHAGFNQSDETWQGLENYLLDQATGERKKLIIFTGPVLTEDDPIYRGVRLPLAFWKIAVQRGEDNTRVVSAYLLDQSELIAQGLERFNARSFQITIEELGERTGLDFAYLAADQVKLDAAGEGLERSQDHLRKPITRLSQIVLKKAGKP